MTNPEKGRKQFSRMVPSNANHLFLRNMLHYMVSVTKIFIFYLVLLLIKNEVLYPFSDFCSIYFMKKKIFNFIGVHAGFCFYKQIHFLFHHQLLGAILQFQPQSCQEVAKCNIQIQHDFSLAFAIEGSFLLIL